MMIDRLLSQIERHIKRTGTTPTTFGRAVNGDPCLVFDLRTGRQPTLKTVEKIKTILRRNRDTTGETMQRLLRRKKKRVANVGSK